MNALVQSGDQSVSVENLLSALAAAHSKLDNVTQDREVEVPIKDKQNPGQFRGKYKFRYATLAGTLHYLRPFLTDEGVWYTQRVRNGEMITRLFHKSGEWMDSGHLPMPDFRGSPQDLGSIISYFKRYSLGEALGIASEEDTDGNTGEPTDGRDMDFRGRAGGRDRGPPADEEPQVQPPKEGWGDWARGLELALTNARTTEEIDKLAEDNKAHLAGVLKVDRFMAKALSNSFKASRAVAGDGVAF